MPAAIAPTYDDGGDDQQGSHDHDEDLDDDNDHDDGDDNDRGHDKDLDSGYFTTQNKPYSLMDDDDEYS